MESFNLFIYQAECFLAKVLSESFLLPSSAQIIATSLGKANLIPAIDNAKLAADDFKLKWVQTQIFFNISLSTGSLQ